jgi:aminoglycoside phosphotransferase (APT) family kinase protein
MDTTLKIYASGETASQEVRLLRMMTNETGVPVPRVLYSAEGPERQGETVDPTLPWALFARLPGRPLSDLCGTLDAWESEAVGYEVGRYLGHIHQIPLAEFGALFAPGPHNHLSEKGFVLSQIAEWLEECAREELLVQERLEAIRQAFMETDLLDRRRACLVHGDLVPANITVEQGATGYHVTGITGFSRAVGCSPELDIGWLFAQPFQDEPNFRKGFLDGYTEAGELGARFWDRLALYQVFACVGALLLAHRQQRFEGVKQYRTQIDDYLGQLVPHRGE